MSGYKIAALPGGPAQQGQRSRTMPEDETVPQEDEYLTGIHARSTFAVDSLDDFLNGVHNETATGKENGMPSLEWLKATFKTKSATIRYLHGLGYDYRVIADHLGTKYQHVYNVCNQHLKRGPNEVYTESAWQCPHNQSTTIVDVIVRKGSRDPDSSRILYRVCADCAQGIIPGVTAESLAKALPGTKG